MPTLHESLVERGTLTSGDVTVPWYTAVCREWTNGYIRFPTRPVKDPSCEGILAYVAVHGGITFAQEQDDGSMLYGYDTNHVFSGDYPTDDPEWHRQQCQVMLDGILLAVTLEDEYLLAEGDQEARGKIAARLYDSTPLELRSEFGLGVMLKIICGDL